MTMNDGGPSPRFVRVAFASLAICFFGILAYAQQRVSAPHDPVPPKVDKPFALPASSASSIVGGPWMVGTNFKSTIYVKNLVETAAVKVTPILYLSNGARYVLADLDLSPGAIQEVDVNAALQKLGVTPTAMLTGYMEIHYQWPWVPICATIKDLDTADSLIFYYGSRTPIQLPNQPLPAAGPLTNAVEGVWWKQEPGVTGFLALSNTGGESVSVQVDVSDNLGVALAHHTVEVPSHQTVPVTLSELDSASAQQGGIRVAYTANSHTSPVLINGGLEDQSIGYSAVIPFVPAPSSASASKSTVAELGMMTGPVDPMLHFPQGIIFTPYTVLRNISSAPLTIAPTL